MIKGTNKKERVIIFVIILNVFFLAFISNAHVVRGVEQVKNAWGETFACDDIGMTLSLPNDWYVFTKDNVKDNPDYAYVNTDEDTMEKHFSNNALVFDCLEAEGKKEISCTVEHSFKSNKIINMKNMDIDDLNTQGKALIDYDFTEEEKNILYKSYEILDSEFRFLVFNGILLDPNNYEKELAEFIQYTTIVNGDNITLQYYSYGDEISATDEIILENVINSIKFDTISNEVKYSTDLILKSIGIILFIILAVLSVVWNIRRYKKRMK